MDREIELLGARVKACREEEGMTLLDLAERSGVAPSTVQKIEKGHMVPTIAVLMKIARGLRRRVSYFLGDEEGSREVSHRSATARSAMGTTNQIRVERLAADLRDPDFDAYEIIVPPGKSSGKEPLRHRGDELAIGLQGEVEFHIGGDQFVLRAGDSLHFKSSLPHSWRNAGGRTARMIVVGSMPRSFQSAEIENRIASARRRAS
jgi:transcriptional regulator with XRE-family HTH domain